MSGRDDTGRAISPRHAPGSLGERMAAGHDLGGKSPKEFSDQRILDERVRTWKYDQALEHVAHIKATDPAAFRGLASATKMSLGYYEYGKAIAKDAGVDVRPPQDAA